MACPFMSASKIAPPSPAALHASHRNVGTGQQHDYRAAVSFPNHKAASSALQQRMHQVHRPAALTLASSMLIWPETRFKSS